MLRQRRRLRDLPINSLIPNVLTVLALAAGMTSIKFSLESRWELAVSAILLAGLFDGLDGRLARLLKGTSKFGAELDSLSDFVSFGVAPAVSMYLWTLSSLKGAGWIIALAFAICCGLRLARFNTAIDEPNRPVWMANYFVGVAAPAAAGLCLVFMVISFYAGTDIFRDPYLNAVWFSIVAFLMVSRIPTFSMKRVRVRRDFVMPILLFVGLFAAGIVTYPWEMLSILAVTYVLTIPFSVRAYRRNMALNPHQRTERDPTRPPPPGEGGGSGNYEL